MSEDDAKSLGKQKEEAGWFFRLDKAKGNYSAPARGAEWFERGEIEIEDEWIGIASPWEPPPVIGPSTLELERILDGIANGDPAGNPWSDKLSNEPRSVANLLTRVGIEARSHRLALEAISAKGVTIGTFKHPTQRHKAKGLRTQDGRPMAHWEDDV